MQYLLMCCIEEKHWNEIASAQRDGIMREYAEWVQATTASGHYRAGAKLRGAATATTVRERNGKTVITDGPYAETKEQLGGYHLLECRDLDEALALARRIPTLRVGGAIEVRPVQASSEQVISAILCPADPAVTT